VNVHVEQIDHFTTAEKIDITMFGDVSKSYVAGPTTTKTRIQALVSGDGCDPYALAQSLAPNAQVESCEIAGVVGEMMRVVITVINGGVGFEVPKTFQVPKRAKKPKPAPELPKRALSLDGL
jgi:hypothetical protein